MDKLVKENLEKLEENLDKLTSKAKAKMERKLTRDNSILVIIDIQEKLAPVIRNKDQVIKNSNILIDTARELDIPIVVTEQYPEGLGASVEELRDNFSSRVQVFSKISFSAYADEAIRSYIEDSNRPNVIVAGMEGHICVYQTVRDLQLKGYNAYLIADAVGSRTQENHENGLELMRSYGARISNTETVLFELLERAGTDEFRKLSKLIK